MPDRIYLDHNATTHALPEVAEAVHACMQSVGGNPNSQHAEGRAARRVLEAARETIAETLGAKLDGRQPDRLILTSGGTESNNLALRSAIRPDIPIGQPPAHIVISAIEHPSVDATATLLASEGIEVDRAPVGPGGVVAIEPLLALVRPSTQLVSVMLANNETGVLQPVAEVARRCAELGVPVHTDATQAVGKVSTSFTDLGVDLMTFTAHKFHGPAGVGGLLVRGGYPELRWFGGQAGMERPGTPTVALAVGAAKALELWRAEQDARRERMTGLRDRFEAALQRAVPSTVIVGQASDRLPHTTNAAVPGQNRQALHMALDRAGVACSTGSACASGSSEPSPVLIAMGLADEVIQGSLRFSLGATNTPDEIDEAAARFAAVCQRLQTPQPA